jgi:hypothetical protein
MVGLYFVFFTCLYVLSLNLSLSFFSIFYKLVLANSSNVSVVFWSVAAGVAVWCGDILKIYDSGHVCMLGTFNNIHVQESRLTVIDGRLVYVASTELRACGLGM